MLILTFEVIIFFDILPRVFANDWQISGFSIIYSLMNININNVVWANMYFVDTLFILLCLKM